MLWVLTLHIFEYTTKYKFVFTHNLVGGQNLNVNGVDQCPMRGGVEVAKYLENGGYNLMARGGLTRRVRAGKCPSTNCW